MKKFHASLKNDLKTIYKYIWTIVNVAQNGDPEKIIELPGKSLMEMVLEGLDFRLYMWNNDNMFVMIVPQIGAVMMWEKVLNIIHECDAAPDGGRACGLKEIAGTYDEISRKVRGGEIELKETFKIFVFNERHLVSVIDVEATTAVLIALAASPLNSYDHIQDTDYLSAVSSQSLNELKNEGYE